MDPAGGPRIPQDVRVGIHREEDGRLPKNVPLDDGGEDLRRKREVERLRVEVKGKDLRAQRLEAGRHVAGLSIFPARIENKDRAL